jgi:adenosine/AMP kinase
MHLTAIRIDKPDATNFILGQTHFIKSVEDIHETLVSTVPGIKFGLAFLRGLRQMPGAVLGH